MSNKIKVDPNWAYDSLRRALDGAFDQAATGKGKERHATDEPFEEQKICVISRWIADSPVAGVLFQAVKKAVESSRLPTDRAIRELQGAINYLAAAIILLEERDEPVWGSSIIEQMYRNAQKQQEKLRDELNLNLFSDSFDEVPGDCIDCEYAGVPENEMPCKKCFYLELRPHFRRKD